MGLSPAAACGGTAVVDGGQGGAGGAGNASSSAATTTTSVVTSGTGGFSCNVPLPEHTELVYACVPTTSPCPSKDDPFVIQTLSGQLDGACNDASCWCYQTDPEFCSCYDHVSAVPCGPDPTAGSACCYYASVTTDMVCEGRPFVVDGRACTAPPARRDDWMVRLAPCLDGLDREARRALADAWTRDALAEHASIASFARFVLELTAVGAPPDLLRDAQRALADEIAHAEIRFGLASAYAGEPVGPGPLPLIGAELRSSLPAIAAATAREGCIGETLAALCAQAAHDEARDPVVRHALAGIAADEARHAALAWRFVVWAARSDAQARAAVEEVFATARPEPARDTARSGLAAHGVLSAARRAQVLREGYDSVVIPCASELLRHATSPAIAAAATGV